MQSMSDKIFRAIFSESPIGIVLCTKSGKIITANKAFWNFVGEQGREKARFTEFLVPEDRETFNGLAEDLLSGKSDHAAHQVRYRSASGAQRWWGVNISPINTSKHDVLAAFVDDITTQKEYEFDLQEAKESSQRAQAAAERETRTKSDFLANMSHEIRTPIHTITGMTELLGETELDPEQQEYVEQVGFSADVLLSLINDILDFSKIEAGKLSIETIDFDLYKMAEDAVDLVALEAHKKGLDTAVFVDNDVPHLLKGDPVRLRQVIVNLFNNAVKFTEEGEVSVRVEKAEESDDDILLKFSVLDTGIGIPPDKKEKLFKVFSQVDSSTTRKYGGTGLGLSISKNLAEMMGGEIGVESRQNEGSRFWFTARLGKQEEESFYHRLPRGYFSGRALVVDDNETNRQLLCNYLQEWGFTVEAAPDGPRALSLMREAKGTTRAFDMALVDLLMPGMDGWHFASEVNSDPQLEETMLFLMSPTGKSGEEAKMKLLRWFEGYLSKPIKKGKLFQTLVRSFSTESEEEVEELGSPEEEPVQLVEEITGGIVLVAEDHEVNQQLFKTILENMGHEVHLADNGREAVDAVKTQSYNIIFMDVQMPEMNGYEATREIRRQGVTTPIVAVTASALKGEEAKSLDAGMDDFLVKPFKKKDLVPVLEKWLAPDEQESPAGSGGQASGRPSESEPASSPTQGPAPEEEPADVEELEAADEPEEVEELQADEGTPETDTLEAEGGEESRPVEELQAAEHSEEEQQEPAKEGPHSDEPVFNYSEAVQTFMGRKEVVRRVAGSYVEKVRGQMPAIEEALRQGDWERLRGEAHSIKGGGLNMWILRMGRTAADLEEAANNGDRDEASRQVELLKQEFDRFIRYCRHELGWELAEETD
jgi:PAS domain S-box-containing protein